jgi:hypothetical protein
MFPHRIVSIALSVLLLAGCKKEKTTWDTYNSVPVAQGRLYLHNFVADTLLTYGPESLYHFHGTFELFRFDPANDIAIPDTVITKDFALPVTLTVSPGGEFINDIENTTFTDIDAELVEMDVYSGTIDYEVTSPIAEDVIVTYYIPGATLNGNPFSYTTTIPAGSPGNPVTVSGSILLDGVHVDLRGSLGTGFNTLQTQLTVQVSPTGNSVTVGPSDIIHVKTTYNGLIPEYVRGYFGNLTENQVSTGDTLDVFRNILAGMLDLDALDAELRISNNIGAEARVKINSLGGKSLANGTTVTLTHPVIGAIQNLNRALDAGGMPSPYQTSWYFNQLNSNIADFIENMPDVLLYDAEIELNPLGNVSGHNDFLYRNYPFVAELQVDAPMQVGAYGLTLYDTLLVDPFADDAEAAGIQWGTLNCLMRNAFPLDAEITLVLPDEAGMLTDSIHVSQTIAAGIQGSGSAMTPVETLVSATATIQQLKNLSAFGMLGVRVRLDTRPQPGVVSFYATHYMDCKVGVYMKNQLGL